MPIYPIHEPGEDIELPHLGRLTCVIPIGGAPPPITGPTPKPADMTPTRKSPIYGQQSGGVFQLGNDPADIVGGAVHISGNAISGLELRFFGRVPIKVQGAEGERVEFELQCEEYISDVQGTFNGKHLTSLKLSTNKRKLNFGNPDGSLFSWTGGEKQVVVGLAGFADDFINGLSVIYVDGSDDPPYDPANDANIEALVSRDILSPDAQNHYRQFDYDKLIDLREKFKTNMQTVYGSIADVLNDGSNPWGQYIHKESGMHILLHIDNQTKSYVYIFSNQQTTNSDDPPPPSDQLNATIGHYSGDADWTDTVNYVTRGAVDFFVGLAVMWAFGKWFGGYLLKKGTQFVNSALDDLAVVLIERGVMKSATGRMFAQVAKGILERAFKWGIKILGAVIGALIAWGIDALLEFILKQYYMTIRIYNHDGRLVDWTGSSYYGYNESIANGQWSVQVIPKVLSSGRDVWIPGVGWVTTENYVGSYNAYTWTNSTLGGGVAAAMTANRPETDDSVNLMYHVNKGADNSMGLDWGAQSDKDYLNSGKDKKVKHLSFDTPMKVASLSPVLWEAADDAFNYAVFLGELPPPLPY